MASTNTNTSKDDTVLSTDIYEISDFMYHLMVLMAERNMVWKGITEELAERR